MYVCVCTCVCMCQCVCMCVCMCARRNLDPRPSTLDPTPYTLHLHPTPFSDKTLQACKTYKAAVKEQACPLMCLACSKCFIHGATRNLLLINVFLYLGSDGSWAKTFGRNRNPGNLDNFPVLTVRPVQIGAPPWQSMRPVDEQEVRQVCSDRHETCTLLTF